jgi:hypothetical protein
MAFFFEGQVSQTQLTSVENMKTLLGLTVQDTTFDAQLGLWIARATSLILDYIGVADYSVQTVSNEILSGCNTPFIWLSVTPVLSITSCYEDDTAASGDTSGSFASTTLLTQGVDFCLDWDNGPGSQSTTGKLTRLGTYWARPAEWVQGLVLSYPGPPAGNIKVSYTAGQSPPLSVVQACELMVSKMRQIALFGQHPTSVSKSGVSVSVPDSEWLGLFNREIASTLARERTKRIAI